jgi:hypothetical protein
MSTRTIAALAIALGIAAVAAGAYTVVISSS